MLMAMAYENISGGDVFKNSSDFDAVQDLQNIQCEAESLDDLFNVSFEDLEDSMPVLESIEDLFNESFKDLVHSKPVASNIFSPEDEWCTNFKRKSHHNLQPDFKRSKPN